MQSTCTWCQSRWDGACPQRMVFSLSHKELPQGPLCFREGYRKRGLAPRKEAPSLNELRKAHLLAITAQDSAITSCRERQDVCLEAAACGSPLPASARRSPSLKEAQEAAPGVRKALPLPHASWPVTGRMREQRRSRRGAPLVPPTTPGETLSTFPGALPAPTPS